MESKLTKGRLTAVVLAIILALSVAASVQADPFTFDPDGGGGAATAQSTNTFDYQPGNALAVGGQTSVASFISTGTGTTFSTLFQARLGSILSPTNADITPASLNNTFEITIVSRFQETTNFATTAAGGIASFTLVPGGVNFIEVYFDPTPDANSLAGTGFNDGTLIMSGTVTAANSNFQVTSTTPQNLDAFGGTDNYPAIDSVTGNGSTQLQGSVNFVDPAFFTQGLAAFALTLFNTSQVLPFNEVDPSAMFVFASGGAAPVTAGAGTGVGSLGTVNGCFLGTTCGGGSGGPDVQFQTDANQTFRLQQKIPEPSSLLLFGSGLIGLATLIRRIAKK